MHRHRAAGGRRSVDVLGHDDQRVGVRPGRRPGASPGRRPGRTTYRPSSTVEPRRAANWRLPGGRAQRLGRTTARTVGRWQRLDARASVRITGRTNTSNETNALTGLPGRVKIGVASGPIVPKPCGMPGLHRHLVERDGAEPASTSLTDVVRADADPAGGDDAGRRGPAGPRACRAARRGSSGDDADPVGDGAGLAGGGGQREAVGVGDLPGPERLAGSTSSLPVDRTTTRGRGRHDDAAAADRGEQRRSAPAPSRCRRRAPGRPAATSSPARRTCVAGVGRAARCVDAARARRRSTRPARRRRRRRAPARRS